MIDQVAPSPVGVLVPCEAKLVDFEGCWRKSMQIEVSTLDEGVEIRLLSGGYFCLS